MPGQSRSKNGVLSHAYVPGIHALRTCVEKDVDGRNKSGHDEMGIINTLRSFPRKRESMATPMVRRRRV
jgi:hypothetical protein